MDGISAFQTPSKPGSQLLSKNPTPSKSALQQKLTVEQATKLRRKKFKEKLASTEAQLVKQLISPYVDDLEDTK